MLVLQQLDALQAASLQQRRPAWLGQQPRCCWVGLLALPAAVALQAQLAGCSPLPGSWWQAAELPCPAWAAPALTSPILRSNACCEKPGQAW